ncbi:MAG: helix-turn-helix domain-containing protein [archaeon]
MKNHITKEVISILRTTAHQKGISVSSYAKEAGISKAWVSKLQNDTSANLSVETAEKILSVAGYKLEVKKK